MEKVRESGAWGRAVTPGMAALVVLVLLQCCSSGGRRPGSDPVDSGDSETETESLIVGESPRI